MRKSRTISKGLYQWTRQLHLYFGIFISPFILLFAISAILLNHRWQPNPREHKTSVPVQIAEGLEKMELVNSILAQLNLTGEVIGRGQVQNNQTVIRVTRPGKMKIITVDMLNKKAEIVEKTFGFLDALQIQYLWFFKARGHTSGAPGSRKKVCSSGLIELNILLCVSVFRAIWWIFDQGPCREIR